MVLLGLRDSRVCNSTRNVRGLRGEYLLAEGVKVNGPAFANVNITSLAEEMTPGVTAADAEFERDR